MAKQIISQAEYLQDLKAHDWTYNYASGDAYYKGEANEKRLRDLSGQDEGLVALRKAYSDFIWNGGQEPTLRDKSAPVRDNEQPAHRLYNLQDIMWSAWKIARKAARKFGGMAIQYIGGALRQAWALTKAKALNSHQSNDTPDTVFYICIDEKISRNTRILNQPLIDQVYTDQVLAIAALKLLSRAFAKPFIKSSPYFNIHN